MTEIPVMTPIIEATPAIIPTSVNEERSLWLIIAEMAIRNISINAIYNPARY
jgi:hypothetical protein